MIYDCATQALRPSSSPTLHTVGKRGLRTARDIDRAARWTAAAPRGRRYWIVRCAALLGCLAAGTRSEDSSWLLGLALFVLAELVAPGPVDLDQPEPEPIGARHGSLHTVATVGLLIVAGAAVYPFQHGREAQGGLLVLVVALAEWRGPRMVAAIRTCRARHLAGGAGVRVARWASRFRTRR